MYTIEVNGKVHRYATLEHAKAVAALIFQHTNIVVGIECESAES